MRTQQILELAMYRSNVESRVKLARMEPTLDELVAALKECNARIADKTPAMVTPFNNNHCHVYNASGKYLIINKPVFNEYAHLPIANRTSFEIGWLYDAASYLTKQIGYATGKFFKNGNLYSETKIMVANILAG